MANLSAIRTLVKKEFVLEWRQKYAIGGILLYVFSTIFVVYFAFVQVDGRTWNALFWIIVLFASVNAVAKSFVQENSSRQLYYYCLTDPVDVLFAKMAYNVILLGGLSIIAFAFFSLVAGNPVRETGQFFLLVFLGSLGFSIAFTFISAISSKANNSATLMAILSFPVIIPMLLILLKISAQSMRLITDTGVWRDILILLAIDAILVTTSFLLFPYLWKD